MMRYLILLRRKNAWSQSLCNILCHYRQWNSGFRYVFYFSKISISLKPEFQSLWMEFSNVRQIVILGREMIKIKRAFTWSNVSHLQETSDMSDVLPSIREDWSSTGSFGGPKFDHLVAWILVAPTSGPLTHWGRMTHICVSKLTILGSDNGLSPSRRQAIIWTNAGILLIGPLGTNFSEIIVGIQSFSFRKMHLKMLSAL